MSSSSSRAMIISSSLSNSSWSNSRGLKSEVAFSRAAAMGKWYLGDPSSWTGSLISGIVITESIPDFLAWSLS